jgi:hypothetical protein
VLLEACVQRRSLGWDPSTALKAGVITTRQGGDPHTLCTFFCDRMLTIRQSILRSIENRLQSVFHPANRLDAVRPSSLAVTSPHSTGRHAETRLEPISAQHAAG